MIRSIGIRRLMRWGAGVLVLLLAQGLGAPRSAWADCGHQVTSQADRRLELHRLDELITGEVPGRPDPRPCSGPGCSRNIPRPASTATTTATGPDQWIVRGSVLDVVVADLPRIVPDEPAARPIGHPPSVFHPPPA